MAIIPTFIQDPSATLMTSLIEGTAVIALALLLVRGSRRAFALIPPVRFPAPDLGTAISLGALASLASPGTAAAAAAYSRSDVRPSEITTSPALDERVPPPRSLVRAGGASMPPEVHPAIHGSKPIAPPGPLFPRGPMVRSVMDLDPWERGAIDLRRADPARLGNSGASKTKLTHWTVLPGDSLWDIAAKVLETDDLREIARYWPLIHRENRDVIGRDPNQLRPGQVLTLPRKARA